MKSCFLILKKRLAGVFMLTVAMPFLFVSCGNASEMMQEFNTDGNTTGGEKTDGDKAKIKLRFSFDGKEAIAVMTDNPTTQSLLKQLPITVNFDDYAAAEKVANFPQGLSRDGGGSGYDPQVADIACYGPWRNMAIYYRKQPYASGLIYMGKIESGLNAFASMRGSFSVTIERINNLEPK